MNLADLVEKNLFALNGAGLSQASNLRERIIHYLQLIEKWNKHYNLTAIKTVEAMVYQHMMDSLSTVAHLYGPRIVDVGTGAGFPGIPIAIARPDWEIVLIERNQKKAAFLQQVKIELNLANVTVVAQRIENTAISGEINTIVSRAYASLGAFIKTTRHLIATDDDPCRWIAMKSSCTDQELNEVINPFFIEEKIPLIVPGLSAKRELIIIRQRAKD